MNENAKSLCLRERKSLETLNQMIEIVVLTLETLNQKKQKVVLNH